MSTAVDVFIDIYIVLQRVGTQDVEIVAVLDAKDDAGGPIFTAGNGLETGGDDDIGENLVAQRKGRILRSSGLAKDIGATGSVRLGTDFPLAAECSCACRKAANRVAVEGPLQRLSRLDIFIFLLIFNGRLTLRAAGQKYCHDRLSDKTRASPFHVMPPFTPRAKFLLPPCPI